MFPRPAAAFAILLFASPAWAGPVPATPEEAQRLTTLFERYVGRPGGQSGAVLVAPDGESYKVTLDASRLFAFLEATGFSVAAGVLTAELTPRSDGQWRVQVNGLPQAGFTRKDEASSFSLDGYTFDGVFDPAIKAFSAATMQGGGSTSRTTGPKGASTVRATGTTFGTSAATDAGGGTVNGKTTQSIKNFRYETEVVPAGEATGPQPAPVTIAVRGASAVGTLDVTNQRNATLSDLWVFLVAHGSKSELAASQVALKTLLKAALPPASSAVGDISASTIAVTTGAGTVGVADFSEHYEINGPASKEGLALTLKVSGLSLPGGLLPAWAAPLSPTGLEVTQTFGPLDLMPTLLTLIDDLDLSADKPLTDDQEAALRDGLSQGSLAVHIAPSTVSTALMTVRFEGDMRIAKPLPTGTATVSVVGLDKTIDQIRAASPNDPNAAQAIALLSAAKSLGKAEAADNYLWRIEAKPGGEIAINGNVIGASPPPKPKTRKKPAVEP